MLGNKKPNHSIRYGYSGQMMHQDPMGYQRNQQVLNRNQPYPYQLQHQNYDWMAYQQQNPYYKQGIQPHPYGQNFQNAGIPQNMPQPNKYFQKDSQFLFHNPLQPKDEVNYQHYMPMSGQPMMNPYPKQSIMPKQSGGVQSIMNSFKSQDGSVDINKMVNTAGQMMNAVTQVSSLVKGFGGFFKA